MAISESLLKAQLGLLKPIIEGFDIETARSGQQRAGELMARSQNKDVRYGMKVFRNFDAEWIIPKTTRHDGVILYLHGGGYTAGDLDYAEGFGSILAVKNSMRVFCPAYRLAPEHMFPAALDDALESYLYLLDFGYKGSEIILAGESAGGGLIYSLCYKLREMNVELPRALIAMSPWTDLTQSGESIESNRDADPMLSKERLQFFADCYAPNDLQNPLVSPVFGEPDGFPPSLILVGGDEILLDDSRRMDEALRRCGCRSEMVIAPGMWHVYILFGLKSSQESKAKISQFIEELFGGSNNLE